MYYKTTNNVKITVEPLYLDDQSEPEDDHYVWAYHVVIENMGQTIIQLRSRHWKITDAAGFMQEIEGEGVVGEQPFLQPGETFEYTSGTPLTTPGGIMVGTYDMESQDGDLFKVDIPAFSLDSPYQHAVVN